MATPDFIRLEDEAIRLTSITRAPDGERMTIIVVVRGSRDHDQLVGLLGRSPLMVELPGEAARSMTVASDEFASTGEGPRTIYRHAIELRTGTDEPAAADTLDDRLARIEEKLNRVLALLERP
jgi:hypothetical protein